MRQLDYIANIFNIGLSNGVMGEKEIITPQTWVWVFQEVQSWQQLTFNFGYKIPLLILRFPPFSFIHYINISVNTHILLLTHAHTHTHKEEKERKHMQLHCFIFMKQFLEQCILIYYKIFENKWCRLLERMLTYQFFSCLINLMFIFYGSHWQNILNLQ